MSISHVKSGNMEVIDSGTVTAFEDNPIEITLDHEDDEDLLTFIFDFVEKGGDPDMETKVLGDNDPEVKESILDDKIGVEFTLYNHRSGLNQGPEVPFHIGTLAERDLYLIYQASIKKGENIDTRNLTYSIYLEDGSE